MSKKSVVKNISALGLVQIANYVFPLISTPVISRIIGPEKFGSINYSFAFVSYFTLLIAFGFDLTATRKISKDPTNVSLRQTVFSQVLFAQFLLLIVSVIIFALCVYFIPPLAAEKEVATFTFLTCLATVFTQNWLFQAMQDLPKVAVLNAMSKAVFTIVVLLVVKKRDDYVWQPLVLSLAQVLVAFLSFFWAIKEYKLKLIGVKFSEAISLLWEERMVFFSMVVINMYTTTNVVVLGLMVNETKVGYYTAAQRLMSVATTVINVPLAQALYPYVGHAFGQGHQKGVKLVQKVIPLIALGTTLSALVFFFIGPIVFRLFYGHAFEPAVRVFQVLAFVPMLVAISNVFGIQIMLNLKMDKVVLRITSVGAVIGITLNYFMVRLIGYIGTAWNLLIVEFYITVTMYFVLKNKGIETIDFKFFRYKAIMEEIKPIINKILRVKIERP